MKQTQTPLSNGRPFNALFAGTGGKPAEPLTNARDPPLHRPVADDISGGGIRHIRLYKVFRQSVLRL
ncbi:hypothetical protein TNCV_4756421 [Trichonephila clavipes]|nr:hypothetical protein TNCV_4756421 [Trichonephila clavipes]